jgi:hypothetical protein
VPGGATPRRYWPLGSPGVRWCQQGGMPRGQARWDGRGSLAEWIRLPPKAAPYSQRVRPYALIALDRGHGRDAGRLLVLAHRVSAARR